MLPMWKCCQFQCCQLPVAGFGVFGVFRGLLRCGGSLVALPPPRRGFEEKRSRFLKLFSVWRGGDPATAGDDEGEDTEGEGACQGGLTPILHFPHFPTIAVFPSPSARRFSAPRRAGFPPRPRAEVRRPKQRPSRPVPRSIPPCVIFAVFPLRKIQNASKSRTVELKSSAEKMREIVVGAGIPQGCRRGPLEGRGRFSYTPPRSPRLPSPLRRTTAFLLPLSTFDRSA